jgi:hypothetical protein
MGTLVGDGIVPKDITLLGWRRRDIYEVSRYHAAVFADALVTKSRYRVRWEASALTSDATFP